MNEYLWIIPVSICGGAIGAGIVLAIKATVGG